MLVRLLLVTAVLAGLCAGSIRGANTAIVLGAQATPLEEYAAKELAHYLTVIFGITPTITDVAPGEASTTFFVGTMQSGPAQLIKALQDTRPEDQCIILRTSRAKGRSAIFISGGSSRAVLWAVYELAERWGVQFLLTGDVFPKKKKRLEIPDLDVVLNPRLRVRQWRLVNEFAAGPTSWGMEQLRPFVNQLVKLRFNRLLIWIWPHQPFLDYQYEGIHRSSATMFFGFRFPITSDMIGRNLFGAESAFANPDIPIDGPYSKKIEAGIQYIRALIVHAKSRGMEVVLPAHLTEFPPEFAAVLKDSREVRQVGTLTITPGPQTDFDDPRLVGLADTILRRTIETYPEVDYIAFSMPEHRQWVDHYQRAWGELDIRYNLSQITSPERMLEAAKHRKGFHSGPERAIAEVKGDLVNLRFYEPFLRKYPKRRFVVDGVAEELYPILDRLLPPGSELLNFIDYTPSRILRRQEALSSIPANRIASVLIYTLHDDNVGLLPQLATHSLQRLNDEVVSRGWAGFSTRYWLLGDQEPCVQFLSKAAWQPTNPEAVAVDYFGRLCGERCRKPMLAALEQLERATELLEWNGLGFAFPVPGMMMKHWTSEPLPAAFKDIRNAYTSARLFTKDAIAVSSPPGRRKLTYWDRRLQFGIEYLDAVTELRAAAAAEKAGSFDETLTHTARALDKVRSSLSAYASVVTDQSDVGAIAVMNEFVYRPVRDKLKEINSRQ